MRYIPLILILILASSCDRWLGPPKTRAMFDTGDLSVVVFPVGGTLTQDTTFRGEVLGTDLAPVSAVLFHGRPAAAEGTNFRTWSVTLTHDELQRASVDGIATLCAQVDLLFAGPVHDPAACIDVSVGETGTGTGGTP